MVNAQDANKDYYPQGKRGDNEGKPQNYTAEAQKPGAPHQTDDYTKYHKN